MCGVRHMVSEDSRRSPSVHLSIAATAVHGEGARPKGLKACDAQMFAGLHRSNDRGKHDELLLLGAQERLRLEEGNHALEEIMPSSDQEVQRGVA